MATKEQIDSFQQFASEQLENGGAELSMPELFDLWLEQNPGADELADSVASVSAAIIDMENGDAGRPFGEFAPRTGRGRRFCRHFTTRPGIGYRS